MPLPPSLPQHIRSYLTGPEVDLRTVSAKQIRKKLATIFPELDVKALRSEIDEISIPIFHEIKDSVWDEVKPSPQEPSPNPPPLVDSKPPQQEIKPDVKPDIKPASSLPPLALPPRGTPGVVQTASPQADKTPANKPATSPTSAPRGSAKSSKRKISDEFVDSDGEEATVSGAGTKTRSVKKPISVKKPNSVKKPKAPRPPRENDGVVSNKGIHAELNLSTPLSELLGVGVCSRPQVVKKLWEYIKANGLQNPEDRRQIICDDAMKKVFNQNSVHMFTMNKMLGDHLYKSEEVVQPPPLVQ